MGTEVMLNAEDLTPTGGEDQKNKISQDTSGEKDRFLPSERRSAVDSTRRSTENQDREEEPIGGEEELPIPDRRTPSDRRKIIYSLTCKTSGSITKIEDWLDENCASEWSVVLQDIAEDFMQKNLRIMFERESDREQFLSRYFKVQADT